MNIFETRYKSHHDVKAVIEQHFKEQKKMVSEDELTVYLSEKPNSDTIVMYTHVPFCDKICSFCNLNRKQKEDNLDGYTDFLINEYKKISETEYMKGKKLEALYFGGGTPTILSDTQLEKILITIRDNFTFDDEYEFTFESTLHNLTPAKIAVLEKYGVNRLSVGIQTFVERGRKILNRTYSTDEIVNKLADLKKNFKGLVCIDIIYNYEGQTVEEIKEDAEYIKALAIDSVSFYSLMIHRGSALSTEEKNYAYDLERDKELHHTLVTELLSTGDYEILEHTKMIRKGKDKYKYISLSNIGRDIVPMGVGSGGGIGNYGMYRMTEDRKMIVKSTDREMEIKRLSGMLQYPVVHFDDMKKYVGADAFTKVHDFLSSLVAHDMLVLDEDKFTLTKEGIFWGNSIGRRTLEIVLEGE